MKSKILYIASLVFLLSATSCSDFLNIKDESGINPAIWDDEASAKLYLNNLYKLCLTPFGGDEYGNPNLSDETTSMGSSLLTGTLNSNSIGNYSADTYATIRLINIALEEMKVSTMSEDAKKRTLGQLYFFRAWVHWKLVVLYGGVPYMREQVTFESPDSIKNAPRNTTSECIAYLKQDLDLAIEYLPAAWPTDEYGRITRTAAAAFKGRILLFYASPQFTPKTSDPTVITARWKDAFEANVFANDLCKTDNIKLMDITVDSTKYWPVRTDLNKVFITKKSDTKNTEAILVTPYYKDVKMHGYENSVCPGELTSARPSNTPSWDLVISFPMRDGSLPFEYSATSKDTRTFTGNGADKLKFYLNRDPRFYSTIAYNGCYYQLEGDQTRRLWIFNFKRKNNTTFYGENTTVDKTTTTGFMNRKMVDPTLNRTEMGRSVTDWVEIRYAEVLLNLAECAFEYEGASSATGIDCVKQIRARAGIDAGTDGSYGFSKNITAGFSPIEIVMNERRVELAYEGKRFLDLRRRNMFTEDLGNKILKLNGWKKEGSGFTFSVTNVARDSAMFMNKTVRDTIKYENIYKYFKMTGTLVGPSAYRISYVCIPDQATLINTNTGNYNFFDIPIGILTRSSAIVQTYGWQNGGFDPFE